jgi:hypothetical protein
MLQGVNTGVMAIAPDDLVAVTSDSRHGNGLEGNQIVRLQDAERIRRLLAFVATAGTRTVIAEVFPRIDAVMTIVPLDDETIVVVTAENERL